MAETALFNVAGRIIKDLGSRAFHEIGLWWGVKDELARLKRTVSTIQTVLVHAEERYNSDDNQMIKEWLEELREVLYDADDLLDDFSTEALRKQAMNGSKFAKEVRLFFSSSNQLVSSFEMAGKLKAINIKLEEIAKNRHFHLEERPMEALVMPRAREQTHSSLPEDFVGRENDKENIIDLLLSPNYYEENVMVIPIVGIGGLGKTTLAQYVFNDKAIDEHFELKLWVCVSDNFDVKLIVEKILESAKVSRDGNQMEALKNQLHEKIKGKKYLLVLDDIWSEDPNKWSRLRDLLACGAKGSRIVVTTRLEVVANVAGSIPFYKLQGLTESESWCLFTKMAFKRGQGPPSLIQETTGKEIVAKCRGVPLAIKTIGCLLRFKESESEWMSFKNQEFMKLQQHEDDILPTLKLSYNYLPSHLKHCFAYCRLFPKDFYIEPDKLIHLWMAQGYINSSDSPHHAEDIGYEYCVDLIQRSFLEVAHKVESKIIFCKMHDLMHDLATLVAGAEGCLWDPNMSFSEKTRHISFYCDKGCQLHWKVTTSMLKACKLRTILFPEEKDWRYKIEEGQLRVIFSKFRCLRVLDLSDLGIKNVQRSIYKLKHLRYLDLSKNEHIRMLPNSITRLHNLQVLNLNFCKSLQQLPKDINNLVNLRRVAIFGCHSLTHMPRGIGELTSLQELTQFVVAKDKNSGGITELHALNNLREILHLTNLQNVRNRASEFKAANLIAKKNLQRLTLEWKEDDGHSSKSKDVNDGVEVALEELQPHHNLKELYILGYVGLKFPHWLSTLINLQRMRLNECKRFQHLPPLHHLPCLEILLIEGLTDLEYMQSDGINGNYEGGSKLSLPSLKILSLVKCPNLKGWWPTSSEITTEEVPQFHRLETLYIRQCPNLTSFPMFPPLERLALRDTNFNLWNQIFKLPQSGSPSTPPQVKIKNVDFLPESLQSLVSLKHLYIFGAPGMALLSKAMCHLTSLVHLGIGDCEELNLLASENDDVQWQGFHRLIYLEIENISKLVSLPMGLQKVTTLEILHIINCPSLISLPEWMGNLTSLRRLIFEDCPQLCARYRSNKSNDWNLIAHIPIIIMDGIFIQKYGHYNL